MAFDSSGAKAVWAARLGTTPKRCELQLFFRRNSTSHTALQSYPSRTLKYAVSAGLAKRLKNYSSFNFLAENLENFRSTELYGADLEGSTIFLCRSSLGSTPMESCRLPELKYAIYSRAGRKTKILPHSKIFLSMVFQHGLLEGSTSEQMWSIVFPRAFDPSFMVPL